MAKEELENHNYDCVIHCAAQVLWSDDTREYINNTIFATENIISFCEKNNIPKLIFMSSISVYGECAGIVNEFSSKTNLNDYALAKLLCERVLEQSTIAHKYILRLSRIIGSRGFDSGSGFISDFAAKLCRNEDLIYTRPNMEYNNLFHISDLGRLCQRLVEDIDVDFLLVGTGADNPLTMEKLVSKMKECAGSSSKLIVGEPGNRLTCHLIDISKLKQLGFQPKTMMETVEMMMKDYRYEKMGETIAEK
jgi:nucleoside-diphosphate-sugar epimerase